jgi:hypothetical protein
VRVLEEHYVALSFVGLSSHHISEMLPKFKPSGRLGVLTSSGKAAIPKLSYEGIGEVVYPVHGDTTFGFGVRTGACVEKTPVGIKFSKPLCDWNYAPDRTLLYVTHEKCPRRRHFNSSTILVQLSRLRKYSWTP